LAVIVGDRHFGRRNQVQFAFVFELEKIRLKLRQLCRAKKRSTIDDERRQCFEVAVFARLNVEHEADQCAFESRAGAIQNRETCRSDLCRTFEVENSERRAKVDVIFWCEGKLRRRAPTTNLDV